MNYNVDDLLGFFSGLFGAIITSWMLGISWPSVWGEVVNVIWIGIGAMFTGGMGMLGKKVVEKYWENRKNKK